MYTCTDPKYQPTLDAIIALMQQTQEIAEYASWDAAESAGNISHHKAYQEVLRIALELPVPPTVAFHLGQAAGSNSTDSFHDDLRAAFECFECLSHPTIEERLAHIEYYMGRNCDGFRCLDDDPI